MLIPSEGPLQLGQPEAIPPRFDIHQNLLEYNLTKKFWCHLIILSSSVETLLPSPDSTFQLGDFFPMVKVTQKLKSQSSEF